MLTPTKILLLLGLLLLIGSCNCNHEEINRLKSAIAKGETDSSQLVHQNHLETRAIDAIKIQMDSLDIVDQQLLDSTRAVYGYSPMASEYIYSHTGTPPLTLKDIIEDDSGKLERKIFNTLLIKGYGACCQFIADTVSQHYKRLDGLKEISLSKRKQLQQIITGHKNNITDNKDKLDSIEKQTDQARISLRDLQ